MAIVGQVGSGKSSLIASILGELFKLGGRVRINVSPVSLVCDHKAAYAWKTYQISSAVDIRDSLSNIAWPH